MIILQSLTYYVPYLSGLTLYAKRLAEGLDKHGMKVNILCMRHSADLPTDEIINNIHITRAKTLIRISKGFISLDWLIKSYTEVQRSDVVFIHLPQFEGIIPAIFAKLFRKRLIVIYHCDINLPKNTINYLAQFFLQISNFISLSLSEVIINNSEDFSSNSNVLKNFMNKISYIYPPVAELSINKRKLNLLNKKLLPDKYYKIGFLGRFAEDKGIDYLINAVPYIKAKIQKFKIIIAGSQNPVGEEKYKRKILDLVEKYKDYVVFLGELKEDEMGPFYSLLDVLVLPSINSTEAFGMVQVEAMLMGVPVVATDLPGVRIPIQKTGMGLLVPIKNSNKLAEAIVEVIINKAKFIKDKVEIKKEFSFEKTIEFYEKIIHEK